MENHPIPQDVTGFQFRLIGDMTVKQFAYLAIPSVLVVILWYMPIMLLIKAILIPIFGLTGLAFAFLPVEGRPLDLMASNFLKALITPNQYIFQKSGGSLSFLNLQLATSHTSNNSSKRASVEDLRKKEELLSTILKQTTTTPLSPMDIKESNFVASLFNTPTTPSAQLPKNPIQQATPLIISTPIPEPIQAVSQNVNISPLPVNEPIILPEPIAPIVTPSENQAQPPGIDSEDTLKKQAEEIQNELEKAKLDEAHQKTAEEGKLAHAKVTELDQKLQDVLTEKQKLEQELIELKKQLSKKDSKGMTPTLAKEEVLTQNVRKIPNSMSRNAGMPTPPDVPNLLMGIIKDPRGNILPNILVEVKDQQGNPVRAFKTNPLGQFASATILQNGVYTLSFEDPQKKHKFELIELTVNDQIIQPLEIISVDAREELRQQLFN